MSDLSLFYSSMSNVLNQWSDFRVSKNLYKEYFNMQKSNAKASADEAAESLKKTETKTTTSKTTAKDKLSSYANSVTSAASKLESAFKTDDAGEIDYDKAFTAAKDFVNSYNDLYKATRQSGNATVSGKSEFVNNMTNANSRKLENVGISIKSDGTLEIDEDKFKDASAEDLDKVFGKSSSFSSFMKDQAKSIAAYASSDAYLNANTYTKTGATTAAASNATAVSGLLYNNLF